MAQPQAGIFSLGTVSHQYLELDLVPGADPRRLVELLASLRDTRKTTGGVNSVVGFAPALWQAVAPEHCPTGVTGFEPVVGPDGFGLPATQHDAWLWAAGAGRDAVFDVARLVAGALAGVATVADEAQGFSYHDSRDITGFIDGTENPPLDEAVAAALVPDGEPGEGASIALVQRWIHDLEAFHAQSVTDQERTIGRTRLDSVELDDDHKPADAHISRVVIHDDAGEELEIFRRSTPIGGVREHGLEFVAFTNDQTVIDRMLHRMVGAVDGVRDRLTRFTTPVTGAYYVVPGIVALSAFAEDEPDA